MPWLKEHVSVRFDEKQKCILLANLKELYLEFIKSNDDEISFSKFCELRRPKWCVTVNSRGMHSVCVCQQHQKVKLPYLWLQFLITVTIRSTWTN